MCLLNQLNRFELGEFMFIRINGRIQVKVLILFSLFVYNNLKMSLVFLLLVIISEL